jgi:polysaccharide pyruvyl transferase WcaK-like protein
MLEYNKGGLRSSDEIETMISKMDVVITTRLHGTVLSIKNGVPVIPIDPIAGGAKITRQVQVVGWPVLFNGDILDDEALLKAFEYCLTSEARHKAIECRDRAICMVEPLKQRFIDDMTRLADKEISCNV